LARLLDEFFHPLQFLLKTGNEIGGAVLEEDDKTDSENDEKDEPEQSPNEAHARTLT
jgi:hypothetical protein